MKKLLDKYGKRTVLGVLITFLVAALAAVVVVVFRVDEPVKAFGTIMLAYALCVCFFCSMQLLWVGHREVDALKDAVNKK